MRGSSTVPRWLRVMGKRLLSVRVRSRVTFRFVPPNVTVVSAELPRTCLWVLMLVFRMQ